MASDRRRNRRTAAQHFLRIAGAAWRAHRGVQRGVLAERLYALARAGVFDWLLKTEVILATR